MGLGHSAIRVLLKENSRRELGGSILSLGRQDVFVTQPHLIEIMREFGMRPIRKSSQILSRKESESKRGFISDEYLFKAIGFSESKTSDVSNYEGADFALDLNHADTPSELINKWDVVLDGGTIEHVFHTPNAMSHIFRLLKVGGRIIHMAPSSNHIDHGFYMFSPTFFWDYYMANGFNIDVCQVIRYSADWLEGEWEVSDYIPGSLTHKSIGGLDDGIFMVVVVATKTKDSTCNVVPQQGMYKMGRWQGRLTVEEVKSGLQIAARGKLLEDGGGDNSPEVITKLTTEHGSPKETLLQRLTLARITKSINFRINRLLRGLGFAEITRVDQLLELKKGIALNEITDGKEPVELQKGTGLNLKYRL